MEPGIEYKNMAFKGTSVKYKNNYEEQTTTADVRESGFQSEDATESGSGAVQYAQVEFVGSTGEISLAGKHPVSILDVGQFRGAAKLNFVNEDRRRLKLDTSPVSPER